MNPSSSNGLDVALSHGLAFVSEVEEVLKRLLTTGDLEATGEVEEVVVLQLFYFLSWSYGFIR